MSQQWTPPASSGASGSVPNYMVPAIISVFCCWPLAIVAIIFAAQVNGKVASGDMQGAMDASKKAKLFSYLGIGLGSAAIVLYLLFFVVFGGLAAISSS